MTHLLAVIAPLSLVIVLLGLMMLSRRLGSVSKRRPLYRIYYIGITFVTLGGLLRVLWMDSSGRLDAGIALFHDFPLFLGLLIGVVVAWRYWAWLLTERD